MFCNNDGTRPSSLFFFFSLVSQILTRLRAYHKNFSQLNILERRYSHCRVNLNISSAIVHGRYRTRNVKSICVSTLLLSFLFLPSFFLSSPHCVSHCYRCPFHYDRRLQRASFWNVGNIPFDKHHAQWVSLINEGRVIAPGKRVYNFTFRSTHQDRIALISKIPFFIRN